MVKNKSYRRILWILIGVYFLMLTYLILFKFYNFTVINNFFSNWTMEGVLEKVKTINLVPLKDTFHAIFDANSLDTLYYKKILIYNIIAFIPYGVILPLLFKKMNSLKKLLLVGIVTSFCYEVIQIITTLGAFDIDDIILNTVGTCIGFILIQVIVARKRIKSKKELSY